MGAVELDATGLIGRWAPDLLLDTGTGPVRLAELTRAGRPLLLDGTEGAMFADAATAWTDRVDIVTARPPMPGVTALLLRPDCYVAWASSSTQPEDRARQGLTNALRRWFGEQAPVAAATRDGAIAA